MFCILSYRYSVIVTIFRMPRMERWPLFLDETRYRPTFVLYGVGRFNRKFIIVEHRVYHIEVEEISPYIRDILHQFKIDQFSVFKSLYSRVFTCNLRFWRLETCAKLICSQVAKWLDSVPIPEFLLTCKTSLRFHVRSIDWSKRQTEGNIRWFWIPTQIRVHDCVRILI